MLVIDTFNVMHVGGVLPPELVVHTPAELAWLIAQSRYAGTPRVLICDGPMQGTGHTGPAATRVGEARVVYTGAGREADDEIESLLSKSTHPARLVVVSSDRRVIKAARLRRATSLKSDGFLRQLAEDAARHKAEPLPKWVHEIPLDRLAVDQWLGVFGLDGEQAAGLGGSGGEDPRERPQSSQPPAQPPPAPDQSSKQPAERPPTPSQSPSPAIDDETRRLAQEQGVDPDDLDMRRWLGGAE